MNELLYYDLKDSSGLTLTLATQVTRELGRRIVGGHYAEGQLIEDETRLAERFGVSKPVIREAVKLLVGKGLLHVRRGSGTRVRRRANWALLDDDVLAWHLSADLKPDFLRQLMEVRCMIEPKAAAWAAQYGTAGQLGAIAEAQRKMERDALSIEDFIVADAKFHRAILRASNNEILCAMEGVIYSALLSSIRITNADPRKNKTSIPFHQKVMRAILDRNSKAAEQSMLHHLDDTQGRLVKNVAEFKT